MAVVRGEADVGVPAAGDGKAIGGDDLAAAVMPGEGDRRDPVLAAFGRRDEAVEQRGAG